VLLGGGFLWLATGLFRTGAEASAVRLFRFSIVYLFLLFTMMSVDAWLRLARAGRL